MKTAPLSVTDAQGHALLMIERHGAVGGRNTGGAIRRMVERMRADGWLKGTWGGWEITGLGLAHLKLYQHRQVEREARFMRRGGKR